MKSNQNHNDDTFMMNIFSMLELKNAKTEAKGKDISNESNWRGGNETAKSKCRNDFCRCFCFCYGLYVFIFRSRTVKFNSSFIFVERATHVRSNFICQIQNLPHCIDYCSIFNSKLTHFARSFSYSIFRHLRRE